MKVLNKETREVEELVYIDSRGCEILCDCFGEADPPNSIAISDMTEEELAEYSDVEDVEFLDFVMTEQTLKYWQDWIYQSEKIDSMIEDCENDYPKIAQYAKNILADYDYDAIAAGIAYMAVKNFITSETYGFRQLKV